MGYIVGLLIFMGIYTIAALSFTLLLGHAGIFSVATATFMGIGAYTTGFLTLKATAMWPLALVAGAVIGALLGWAFARATLRVSGDYMVVASFAVVVLGTQIFTNWTDVTGGGNGLAAIPRPAFGDMPLLDDDRNFVMFVLVIALLCYLVTHRIVYSPLGLVLRAMKDNDSAAASVGKYSRRFRGIVFALSSAMASLAGSLYAHYVSYVSPLDFTIHLTVMVLTIIIVAGSHRLWAIPVGAVLVVGVTEGVRYVDLPDQIAPGAQQILYGALLVLFALLRPQGLVGRRRAAKPRPRQTTVEA